ncbi:hypothetical protein GCM10007886_06050 [Methylobacterium gregans]|uniref:tyrosine-type recombinase/integrase n=1 Tax=Methylobacterium gregans TaxID=374424 RepID=UPI001EE36045|nr:tyrosine-type recombinase/integrase [Methylobacterium gregans]GLS52422.1 hypothetical protein GCM10007886_06050 [Methylobacterium gregans]
MRLLAASLGFIWDPLGRRWRRDADGRLIRRDRVTRTRRAHIRRFILIGIYTGTRHEAIEPLQCHPNTTGGWFDLERGRIYRRGEGERETRKRRQPEKVAHRLVPHLTRWAASDAEHGVLHVIHTSSGDSLSTPIRTGWRGCLRNAGLDAKVVPHVMRHTAATWLMQAGVDVWEAADMLGMMMETLHGTYERQHPDFQDGAAGAFRGEALTPISWAISWAENFGIGPSYCINGRSGRI